LGPYIVFLFGCAAMLLSWTCSSASSLAGPRGTEAAVRHTGALVALVAASVLVLFPSIEKLKHAVMFVYTICFAAVLSLAYRSVAQFVRWAAKAAGTSTTLHRARTQCLGGPASPASPSVCPPTVWRTSPMACSCSCCHRSRCQRQRDLSGRRCSTGTRVRQLI
jgi:hypothetical protein